MIKINIKLAPESKLVLNHVYKKFILVVLTHLLYGVAAIIP